MGIIRRYQSEIYGRYRRAYLRDGLWSALVLSGVVLVCKLIYYPIDTPHSLITDISLLVATLFFAYRYRATLPDRKVTFKELMLYGLGLGIVAAFFYGLFLWLYGGVLDGEFCNRCMERFIENEKNGNGSEELKEQVIAVMRGYRAWTWAAIGAFLTAVMSILTAFIAALVFKTENGKLRARSAARSRTIRKNKTKN